MTQRKPRAMMYPVSNIFEGLSYEEMQGLVLGSVSIDQYKPKVDKEENVCVVAITVSYEQPAKDLSNFIETGALDHLDVEISGAPNNDGEYKVFIEFSRDKDLYKKIRDMLNSINRITSDKGEWKFTGYKMEGEQVFNKDNFNKFIMSTPEDYRKRFNRQPEDQIKERMEFLVKY